MNGQCNVLKNDLAGMGVQLRSYLKNKDIKVFIDKYLDTSLIGQTRFVRNTLDSKVEIQDQIKQFMEAFDLEVNELTIRYPKFISDLLRLRIAVENQLFIEADATQIGSANESNSDIDSGEDVKTVQEAHDLNRARLNEHLQEIYGTGSYEIITHLKEVFGDAMTSIGYWDAKSGALAIHNNDVLNRNILNYKNKLYSKIVEYLQKVSPDTYNDLIPSMENNGTFIGSQYYKTLNAFYQYIKNLEDFNSKLIIDNQARLNGSVKTDKQSIYVQITKVLNENEKFNKAMERRYGKTNRRVLANTQLFTTDSFSEYYFTVKDIVAANKLEDTMVGNKSIRQLFDEIEHEELTLLQAVNAYTSLTHFDELLKEIHGESFQVKKGSQGIENADLTKYSYHRDAAHDKKSWQQGESIESEKFTSNLTKNVFNLIKIYDYKTKRYTNRRLNATLFIIASHNLLDDIVYGRLSFNIGKNNERYKAVELFIKSASKLHDNPTRYLLRLLEILFDESPINKNIPLFKDIANKQAGVKRLVTDNDLNILYSIYNQIFNKNNRLSLFSVEVKARKGVNGAASSLLGEIAGYVDRNASLHYLETSYDHDGNIKIQVKRKFSNNIAISDLINSINQGINTISLQRRLELSDKYSFWYTKDSFDGKRRYSVRIGNHTFTVHAPSIGNLIFNGKDTVFEHDTSVEESPNEIFKNIRDKIDIIQFRNKILGNDTLDKYEQDLYDILNFIDDFLGLKILGNPEFNLQILDVFKGIYDGSSLDGTSGTYYIEPLLKLAIRAAYVNDRYHLANTSNMTLKQFLENSDLSNDGVYQAYVKNKETNRVFSERWNDVKYQLVSRTDDVLSLWADARYMLTGEASKATTKDKSGNSIPNNSVNKLGNILPHYLAKQKGTNVLSLLFVNKPELIKSVYHDLEVTSWNNESKQIKGFTSGELFFHSIFNKFWGNYFINGSVVIQPTTYSDKTTFLNWDINTKLDGNIDVLSLNANHERIVLKHYIDSIGQTYKNIWNSTVQKLLILADKYNLKNNTNLTYKQVLGQLSEDELCKLADEAGVKVELDKDYRIIKTNDGKKVCVTNELLEYYANELYANVDTLKAAMNEQKSIFVENLLQSNSSFLVIDYSDDINIYYDDDIKDGTSNNVIIKTIKNFFKTSDGKEDVDARKGFFRDWVDASTGKLILAKQDKQNIIGIGNNFDSTKKVELNPLLDKFFYVESLLSNNLRMSLTGSEINHPDKAKKTSYNLIKSAKYGKGAVNDDALTRKFNNLLGLDLTTLEYLVIQTLLKENTRYVGDISNLVVSDERLRLGLNAIRKDTLLSISNTAQGTLFKRNVIIPATLLYCRQNYINGVSSKIKCAVIRDEQAHVWNYRGDRDGDIDAADGSAQINPFQSILENKSLDSLAVGFIKKPIWHSYDSESGSAFLAKFATDTITNEAMRASLLSTSSLYRLFRKMTNLQWKNDVNLLESITLGKLDPTHTEVDQWFLTQILGNVQVDGKMIKSNRLIYKNEYDEPIEIIGFNATNTLDGKTLYYTKEAVFSKNPVDDPKVTNVYHVFYDTPESKSVHITFDTWEKANKFINTNQDKNAHTINSLFELHTALGGINNIDSKGNYSEFSNEVVVNFMNAVGRRKYRYRLLYDIKIPLGKKKVELTFNTKIELENYKREHPEMENVIELDEGDIIDQLTYYQPLKEYHIGYALNNSAVKNGAKNINKSSAWSDDSELSWFEADSDGLGMQMNADHDIIDSELTEFSQVITATSAYGYTQDQCNEIFLGLAKAALQASREAIDSVDNFLQAHFEGGDRDKAQSDLYDAIGRIILTNLSIKDKESLQGIIMLAVSSIFYRSKNHRLDGAKIPFSDANVYSDFISTLASTINKSSIKRKHPGSGCVMVPAFNTIQYFEIGGKKLMMDDVLKRAKLDYKLELQEILKNHAGYDPVNNKVVVGEDLYFLNNTSIRQLEEHLKTLKLENTSRYYSNDLDVTSRTKHLLNKYLEKQQAIADIYDDASWFMPSDIVDLVETDETGAVINRITTIDMDSLDKYYQLKDGVFEAMHEHNVTIKTDYEKGRYDISLNEDLTQSFRVEKDTEHPEMFNIHFRTGGLDNITQRRTAGDLSPDQKIRLFRAALLVIPVGSKVRLSPTTAELINTGIGGLTTGSIAGWNSIFTNTDRLGNTKIQKGSAYEVTYFDVLGNKQTTMVNEFTKTGLEHRYKFLVNVTKPHNLRPSLIRWLYEDAEGKRHYANIFDSKVIRESYTKPYNLPSDYREQIQNILHSLHAGVDPEHGNIVEGTLENTAAELIMSNLYQDKFNTGGYSMLDILDKGESFFRQRELNVPVNLNYDVAFISDQGSHTLLTFRNVVTNNLVYESPFDDNLLYTNEKDEIILMKGNRELFEVGRWTSAPNVSYVNGQFIDKSGTVLDSSQYRLKDPSDYNSVLKRVMYVTQYTVVDKVDKNGQTSYKSNTLYKIARIDEFIDAMKDLPRRNSPEEDANNLRASIILKMFGDQKAVYINGARSWSDNELNRIERALSRIKSNNYVSLDVKDLLATLLDYLHDNTSVFDPNESEEAKKARIEKQKLTRKENLRRWNLALKNFLDKDAHRKWVSFLDSHDFIASRIPAQTLQSFMTMKLIGWTSNSKNMAYVSHFLTYLLGSDYDIDKAYIMGQSYNDQATYIGWSNLFDYSTYNTLQASKTLPVPKGIQLSLDSSLSNDDVNTFLNMTEDGTMNGVLDLELSKSLALRLLSKIIRSAENNGGVIYYNGPDTAKAQQMLRMLQNHEYTPLHPSISEAAYKNIASANIYAVAHDIRNRDLAYTAISMGILQNAANNSPKGNLAGKLNMLNPFTKYIMQYQNLVGKNVISIAANGEKVWFNAYYYWHKMLSNGSDEDILRLKFSQTFNRIEGRAVKNLTSRTVTHLPDLNYRDLFIKARLEQLFGATLGTLEYKYVDQLISLLLSAATDNAKELILAKINAGTNFARMYVYAMMSGYNIDDIVAFMTSPIAEFIDLMSAPNMFQGTNEFNSATTAINLSRGFINHKIFLHGNTWTTDINKETGLEERKEIAKSKEILDSFGALDSEIISKMKKYAKMKEDEDFEYLSSAMEALINVGILDRSVDISKLLESTDTEINTYLAYCQDVLEKLRSVYRSYSSAQDAINDIAEFRKLYLLSTEISTIASAWLGLNQGLPTSELDILKRLRSMAQIVTKRELALGIVDKDMYQRSSSPELDEDEDWEATRKNRKGRSEDVIAETRQLIFNAIIENNPTIPVEDIEERLDAAHEAGLINNFDVIKYLTNENNYRSKIRDYYGLIMGTLNVFDMMEQIPHYKLILDCFKTLVTGNELSSKSRYINQLLNNETNVTDLQLLGVINFVDQTFAKNFANTLPSIYTKTTIDGFNEYFQDIKTDEINLSNLNGIATFKHWIEGEFREWLQSKESGLRDNGAIKHLQIIMDNDSPLLAMDIDVLHPNTDIASITAYDEILRGMSELEKILFNDDYTIADLLLLYNILVNNNKYGSLRLTTTFKVCQSPNNIMNQYLQYVSTLDYNLDEILEFDKIDYLISSAPIVSPFLEKRRSELYIKVTDPVRGYVIKTLLSNNIYKEYNMVPFIAESESEEQRMKRLLNFAEYSPFLMIHSHNQSVLTKILEYDGNYDEMSSLDQEKLYNLIYNVLKQYVTNNKLWIYKEC